MKLLEGGNVFKDPITKEPLTKRIAKVDVPNTVAWLEQVTGIDFSSGTVDDNNIPSLWLGSTGRAASSGDLDLAVDSNKISKEQLTAVLTKWLQSQGIQPGPEWIQKKGEVHFRTPIAGDPTQGYVQTDFMFFPNLDWGVFFYSGGTDSEYKGMIRNILLSSLAKHVGLKIGANGVISRRTDQVISTDPDQAAEWLLGAGHDRTSLKNVETIYKNLADDAEKQKKLADFTAYLDQANLPQPSQAVKENEVNWMARLRDRLSQPGMYALIEQEEKRAARTPHPEDALFLGGSDAADSALKGLTWLSQNPTAATIKWDGKPALIFGFLPDGSFTIQDKYMWDANFPARSPEDWIAYDRQKATGRLRPDMYPKIKAIWPGLKAATKAAGFYWGDLLWAGKLNTNNGSLQFMPNTVAYTITADSPIYKIAANSTGGVAVHQKFKNFGDAKAEPWDGKGLTNIPGGVAILSPNLGTGFKLKANKAMTSAALKAIKTYGPEVDQMLSALPVTARKQLQTYFNQRITGQTMLSLPNWVKANMSGAVQKRLLGGTIINPPEGTTTQPGLLFSIDKQRRLVPSTAYQGLEAIWSALYKVKLDLANQLEPQITGISQSIDGNPQGEGFVANTPYGQIKLVNRQVFSSANVQKNIPA